MSAPKNFRCLSVGCMHIILRNGKLSQVYSAVNNERRKLFHCCIPKQSVKRTLQHPQNSFAHLYSTQATETEQVPNVAIMHNFPPLKFEDLSFEQPVPHQNLVEELTKCKTVGEQMEVLTATLALTSDDVQKRAKFCKALESFLAPFFCNLRIQMFGSTVNCFGFKGCDIDMTFETSSTHTEKIHYLERPDIPLVSEVLCGKVSPQEISNLPPREQLLFLHTIFLDFYKDSKDAPIFINAHVPLVRFHHDTFNLKCDLTFKNRVAYANTKLLYSFAKLDKRMVPLMMTLRYWAKHVELVGKGLMFNTYTMTLMVVHYLQTRDPPVLPSAEYVKTLSDGFDIEDMDDKSFLEILDKITPSKNTETLEELLRGFFFYYLYFDFTRVICPLIASSVPRDEFFSDDNNRKFRMNSVCVQDPMCVSHNVAELVDFKHCKKLFHELMIACKIFQDNTIVPSAGPWGLMAILDKPEKYSVPNMAMEKLVSFSVPLLSRTTEGKSIPDEKKSQITSEIVHKILDHVLLFHCNVLEQNVIQDLLKQQDDITVKQRKMMESLSSSELQSSQIMRHLKKTSGFEDTKQNPEPSMLEQFQKFTSSHQLILCLECRVLKNTWLGREFANVGNALNHSLDILDREHLISVATAKQNKRNINEKNVKPFLFLCECYVSSNAPETSIVINFRPLQRMSFNPILGIFLQDYILKIISIINNST